MITYVLNDLTWIITATLQSNPSPGLNKVRVVTRIIFRTNLTGKVQTLAVTCPLDTQEHKSTRAHEVAFVLNLIAFRVYHFARSLIWRQVRPQLAREKDTCSSKLMFDQEGQFYSVVEGLFLFSLVNELATILGPRQGQVTWRQEEITQCQQHRHNPEFILMNEKSRITKKSNEKTLNLFLQKERSGSWCFLFLFFPCSLE